MTTLKAIGFTIAGGSAVCAVSVALFGCAVRARSVYIAPRCSARPAAVIYNPAARRGSPQHRGDPWLGWIGWTLKLSYDKMMSGVPGTGTREGGMSGSMLKVQLDAVVLLRFHAMCLRITAVTAVCCLAVNMPLYLTAQCFTDRDLLHDPACAGASYNTTDYERTTINNVPSLNATLMHTIVHPEYNGVLARLYAVVFLFWIIVFYAVQQLKREWIETIALRRVYFMEHDVWEERREEHKRTLLYEENARKKRRMKRQRQERRRRKKKKKNRNNQNNHEDEHADNTSTSTQQRHHFTFDVDPTMRCFDDEWVSDCDNDCAASTGGASAARYYCNYDEEEERHLIHRDPWIPHPEQRDTVPNVALYSVLVGNLPSLPRHAADAFHADEEAAFVEFSKRDNVDWQLSLTSTFFDHCVPNQPGYSSSVAAVTIIPGADEISLAWKKWYTAAGKLRRLRFVRQLIAEKRHFEIACDDDDDDDDEEDVGESQNPQNHHNNTTTTTSASDIELIKRMTRQHHNGMIGTTRHASVAPAATAAAATAAAAAAAGTRAGRARGRSVDSIVDDDEEETEDGLPDDTPRSIYARERDRNRSYYREVLGTMHDDEEAEYARIYEGLSFGPEQTAVYSREFAQAAAPCCPNGCNEGRLRRARIDELLELEEKTAMEVHEANLDLRLARRHVVRLIGQSELSSIGNHNDTGSSDKDQQQQDHHQDVNGNVNGGGHSGDIMNGAVEGGKNGGGGGKRTTTSSVQVPGVGMSAANGITTTATNGGSNVFGNSHKQAMNGGGVGVGGVAMSTAASPAAAKAGSTVSDDYRQPDLNGFRLPSDLELESELYSKNKASRYGRGSSFGDGNSNNNSNNTPSAAAAAESTAASEDPLSCAAKKRAAYAASNHNNNNSGVSTEGGLLPEHFEPEVAVPVMPRSEWDVVESIVGDARDCSGSSGRRRRRRRKQQQQRKRQDGTVRGVRTGVWECPPVRETVKDAVDSLRRWFASSEGIDRAVDKAVDKLARDSTFAVVTFTSRQAAVAARQCLADGRGAERWVSLKDLPIPPLSDAAPCDIIVCRNCCRPVTLSINDRQKNLRQWLAYLLLAAMYIFYTFTLTIVQSFVSPDQLDEICPKCDEWSRNLAGGFDITTVASGLLTAMLYTAAFAVCPIIFKSIANFGSKATSVATAEYAALQYYWWFMILAAFTGPAIGQMFLNGVNDILKFGYELWNLLETVSSAIPMTVSLTWLNWIIYRILAVLPLSYLLQANTFLFAWFGMPCCSRLVRGGGPGGPVPYRIYIDAGVVLMCAFALAPQSPLVAPACFCCFLVSQPLLRRNAIFMYRPKYDGGGLRWPFIFDMCISGMVVGSLLLATQMGLKGALGPAVGAAIPIVPIFMVQAGLNKRFRRSYEDAALMQTSLLDGWDTAETTSRDQREEFRRFLVDAHKAAYVPICIAGTDTDDLLTAEPAVTMPLESESRTAAAAASAATMTSTTMMNSQQFPPLPSGQPFSSADSRAVGSGGEKKRQQHGAMWRRAVHQLTAIREAQPSTTTTTAAGAAAGAAAAATAAPSYDMGGASCGLFNTLREDDFSLVSPFDRASASLRLSIGGSNGGSFRVNGGREKTH